MRLSKIFKPAVSVVLLGVMLSGCANRTEDPLIIADNDDSANNYELVQCARGDVVLTEKIPCTYKKNEEQEVYFPVSGKLVDKVYVKVGDTVSKGDLLAELSAGNLSREIEKLEYQIKRNELLAGYLEEDYLINLQMNHLNYMYSSRMTEADKEKLDANNKNLKQQTDYKRENYSDALEFDRKKLASLKAEFASSRVYAEFDGTVKTVASNLEGSTSNIDKLVMTIVDNDEGYFETGDMEFASYFTEGEPVNMRINVGTGKGEYKLLPLNMESWDGSMLFSIYDGDVENVAAGANGDIIITLDERTNVNFVPKNCVHKSGDKYYVYVINPDGLRDVCFITPGLYGDDRVEVLAGLSEGDSVIRR